MWATWFVLYCSLAQWIAPSAGVAAFAAEPEFSIDPEISKAQAPKPWPVTTYKSSSATPPKFEISQSPKGDLPGYFFLTPERNGRLAALIIKNNGDLVWSGYDHRLATNCHVATLNGKQVLSTWVGQSSTRGWGYGGTSILDQTYTEIHFICPKLGLFIPPFDMKNPNPKCQGDLHESEITEDGQLLVTAYNVSRADLTSVGGPKNGWVVDGQFHAINIATGKPTFSWKSIDHIPLTKSFRPLGNHGKVPNRPYDFLHINSVVQVPGRKQYLVSGRHTSSLYLVDSDGTLLWTFSGVDGGDFKPLPHVAHNHQHFAYQHQARVVAVTQDTMTVSLFNDDNAAFDPTGHPSTGIVYKLNTASMTCDLIRVVHDRADELYSPSQGGFVVKNSSTGNHYIIGYGADPVIKEFGPRGTIDLRTSIRFGANRDQQFYRAYKDVWQATPTTQPSVAIGSGAGYVSWNGATDVTRYVLYYGPAKGHLHNRVRFDKSGYETEFPLPANLTQNGGYLAIGAFNGSERLKYSKIIQVQPQ